MDLPGAPYLYALAALSITFSGFSALLVVLRQTSGAKISPFDVFIIVNYFLAGFAIALVCLLPPLLAGWSSSAGVIWRLPSAIAALLGIAIEAFSLRRRPSATTEPIPPFVMATLVLYWPAFFLLALNACGLWVRPGFAPYATSITWIFVVIGIDFVAAVAGILRGDEREPSAETSKSS